MQSTLHKLEEKTTGVAAAANGPFSEIDCGIFWRPGAPYIVTHCERSNDFLSPNDKIAAAVYCLH